MASPTDFDIESPPSQELENQTRLHDADEGVNLCMRRLYPAGGFRQGAFGFNHRNARRLPYPAGSFRLNRISNPHYSYNFVVNNLNIIPNNRRVEGQPLFNRPRLTETFLSITSQAALAMLTIWTGNDTRLTHTATILFYIAAALNVFGFLSCLFAILIRIRNPQIARIVTGTGFVSAAYGFLAIMTMLLNDNIRLWVAGLACLVCFPALASAFIT